MNDTPKNLMNAETMQMLAGWWMDSKVKDYFMNARTQQVWALRKIKNKSIEADDLERILSEEQEKETPKQPLEEKPQAEEKPDPEVLKKEEIKANLDKAIAEAQDEVKRIRKEKAALKASPQEEEELPKIDMDDPSAKAWNKHIQQQVSPVRGELEQEKVEIRRFALKEFLTDKPSIASKPEKVKEMMGMYERIKSSSERTREGVLLDLDKAYAAAFHTELLDAARGRRMDQAKADALFSDIAVSKGATSYASKDETSNEPLTEEDRRILARWGMSPQEYQDDKKRK